VLDVKPPHVDTGLVDRALAGTPPRLPAGHDQDALVETVLTGMREGSREVALDPKAGAVRSLYRLVEDPRLNHRLEVVEGVRAGECAALLQSFFRRLRAEGQK